LGEEKANFMSVSIDDDLLIVAFNDNACRIIKLDTGDVVKKLSFT